MPIARRGSPRARRSAFPQSSAASILSAHLRAYVERLADLTSISCISVKAIIVSAYGDMANMRAAMNRGAFDFLTKPIDFVDLERTITKTIRHVEVLREAQRRQAKAERAYASLSRYFSPNLAERLSSDTDAIDLGGQRREIATLFTDIARVRRSG